MACVISSRCSFIVLLDFAHHLTPPERRPPSALFQSTYLLREHASKVRRPPVLL